MLADISGNIDEGMKVTAQNLSTSLESKGIEVFIRNPIDSLSISFWRDIRSFEPDIVHYVPGPSTKGIVLGRFCSIATRSPLVMSAPLPQLGLIGEFLLRTGGPNQVFVQSKETEERFQHLGVETVFIPTGVDTDRFVPVDDDTKRHLREKYEIPLNARVVLHVGHIKKGRNLQWLKKLQQRNDLHVVIVGSTTTDIESDIKSRLIDAGCIVRTEYFPAIEEMYALSDVYAFPTKSSTDSIQCPASVIEAMSTNTPVVSTRFGALPHIFDEIEHGVTFITNYKEFEKKVNQTLLENRATPRDSILEFDWEIIGGKILNQYLEVIVDAK